MLVFYYIKLFRQSALYGQTEQSFANSTQNRYKCPKGHNYCNAMDKLSRLGDKNTGTRLSPG